MNKTITIFAFFTLCFFNSNAQLKLNDFDDAQIYFNGIFDENSQIDDYGNVLIDMGSEINIKYLPSQVASLSFYIAWKIVG